MESVERNDIIHRIREVLAAMPDQQVKDGGSVLWGPEGNKARAVHLAARFGHRFDPHCKSCDSDLYYTLKHLAK